MSTVTKRERNGRTTWEARVSVTGHKPRSKTFPLNEKTKAQRWAAALEAELRAGKKVSAVPGKTMLADLIEDYMAERLEWDDEGIPKLDDRGKFVSELPQTTINSLRMVSHYIGELKVEELTTTRVEAWVKLLLRSKVPKQKRGEGGKAHSLYNGDKDRRYSPSAVRKLFYALKEAVTWHARKHGYEVGDRFIGFKLPPSWKKPRNRRLPPAEEALLLAACESKYKDPEGWKLFIRLALASAMRAGELLGMCWDEVDLRRNFIGIPEDREKMGRARAVPLGKEGQQVMALLQARRSPSDPRVFWTLPSQTTIMGRSFKAITKRAGLADLRAHDLRHEAISRLFERTSLRTLEISMITGHSNPATLKRYANLRPEFLVKQIDRPGLLRAL